MSFANRTLNQYSHARIHLPVPFDDKARQTVDSMSINEIIKTINTKEERFAHLQFFNAIKYSVPILSFTGFFTGGGYFKTFKHKNQNKLLEFEKQFILKLEKIFQSELATESLDNSEISSLFI
jgi:hypothetical protein